MTDKKPLVSIGMPVYNGEKYIRQALDSLLAQEYEELEFLISDNGSTDQTPDICQEYLTRDKRICYHRNEMNMGAAWNFNRVFRLSSGKYFMWAAHDDLWEPFYIEQLVNTLEELGSSFVAANFEAQYMDEYSTRFEYFSEAAPFYNYISIDPLQRIMHTLSCNYGNLIYSLYRKDVLDRQNLLFSQNELPFLLQATAKGNWRVLPKVGYFKRTIPSTYQQARWEMTGGVLTRSLKSALFSLRYSTRYHRLALHNIKAAIDTLSFSITDRIALKSLAGRLIWKHWLFLLIGYKPRPF